VNARKRGAPCTAEEPAAVLAVYKPRGMTSHDVVDRVRRILGIRRVGHSGTLDPAAEGVLVLGAGAATRVLRFLGSFPKEYVGLWVGGEATDTYDAEGRVVERREIVELADRDLYAAFAALVGPLRQRPPRYAAVRVGGRRLYDLARAGVDVEPPEREVYVYAAKVCSPVVRGGRAEAGFAVRVSPGTYVRSLAVDVGKLLGIPAHLGALVRLRSGGFTLAEAWTLAELEAQAQDVRLALRGADSGAAEGKPLAYSLRAVVRLFPRVRLDPEAERAVRHGRAFAPKDIRAWEPPAPVLRSAAPTLLGEPKEREIFGRFCGSESLASASGAGPVPAFAAFAPSVPPPDLVDLVAAVDALGKPIGLYRRRRDGSKERFLPEVVFPRP